MRISRPVLLACISVAACNNSYGPGKTPPAGPERTWRMGFSAIPPKPNEQVLLANLELWSQRSDAATCTSAHRGRRCCPASATTAVNANELPLANYYRAKNLQIVVMVDATDGLNRAAEAPERVQLGRSISEPAVQLAYRQFVPALSSIVRPDSVLRQSWSHGSDSLTMASRLRPELTSRSILVGAFNVAM